MIHLKSSNEIMLMQKAGKIVMQVFEEIKSKVRAGVSTQMINDWADTTARKLGSVPAFKGYKDYPASICASINDEIVHGIPSPKKILQEGDLLSLDFAVFYNGYCADAAVTLGIGKIKSSAKRLMDITYNALMEGIKQTVVNNRVSDISYAIQSYVEANKMSVVRELVGHGVGTKMHEEPQVPNFGNKNQGILLEEGLTLAIEPMVNEGTHKVVWLEDGWTVCTADGSLSAHFEHTVAITKDGPLILTTIDN